MYQHPGLQVQWAVTQFEVQLHEPRVSLWLSYKSECLHIWWLPLLQRLGPNNLHKVGDRWFTTFRVGCRVFSYNVCSFMPVSVSSARTWRYCTHRRLHPYDAPKSTGRSLGTEALVSRCTNAQLLNCPMQELHLEDVLDMTAYSVQLGSDYARRGGSSWEKAAKTHEFRLFIFYMCGVRLCGNID